MGSEARNEVTQTPFHRGLRQSLRGFATRKAARPLAKPRSAFEAPAAKQLDRPPRSRLQRLIYTCKRADKTNNRALAGAGTS
jgi:hypothetical protein